MSTRSEAWSPSSFWRFNVAVWSLFAVFEFTVRFFVFDDLDRVIGMTLLQEPIAFAIAGLLYYFYRRPELTDPFRLQTAVWMVVLSLGAGLVQTAIVSPVIRVNSWQHPGWTDREEWLLRFIFISLVYLTWSLIFFGLLARRKAHSASERALKAAEEAQRMELQLLRAQLDPHFLFNSLNGIAAEIEPHPKAALEMVCELSDYLRYSLDQRHRVAAPLSTELAGVGAYLRIEQARFGDRLHTSVDADPESRRRLVPSFLLQPLVENAVKHGMRDEMPVWELKINARARGDVLRIEVRNSGGLVEKSATSTGVGLETLRRRLLLHYPSRHRFALDHADGMVCAWLELEGEPCFA